MENYNEKTNKYRIFGVIGILVGITYFIISIVIGQSDKYEAQIMGKLLFFTIGLPNAIIIYVFNLFGITSDAYFAIVWLLSIFLYLLVGLLIYYCYNRFKA